MKLILYQGYAALLASLMIPVRSSAANCQHTVRPVGSGRSSRATPAYLPKLLLSALFLSACGGGDGGDDGDIDPPVPAPLISSFTASANSVLQGESITLTAIFSDGSGSIDHGVGVVSSGEPVTVSPMESTTYLLTVTNTAGISETASVTVRITYKFELEFLAPKTDGQLVDRTLEVAVRIRSLLDIASVTAELGGLSERLLYADDAYCQKECVPGFAGQIDLSSLTPGETYILTVIAQDMEGDTVTKTRSVDYDNPPIVSVTEPLTWTVARPNIQVRASCTDDLGDCRVIVLVRTGTDTTELASGTNELNELVNLEAYDGSMQTLTIYARDSSRQTSEYETNVLVEASPRLTTVKDFPSLVVDFDGQRVLVHETGGDKDSLSIHDAASGLVTEVAVPASSRIYSAFLTPTGAIFVSLPSRTLYEWRFGDLVDELTELGYPNSMQSVVVAGDYAIFNEDNQLWLRQFSTQQSTFVSDAAGNWENSVATNGVVAYWTTGNYSIVSYNAGVSATLADDVAYWNTYPLTDGLRFVYRKSDPCCTSQQYAIVYHDGTDESLLTDFRGSEPDPGTDYLITGGFVAYTELGGLGQTHVWTRDPTGSLLQRTIFGSDSTLDSLAPDGQVMLKNAGRRYLSLPDGQYSEIGSALGVSSYINGNWYIAIGRSLFLVN